MVKNPEGKVFAVDATARRPKMIDDKGTMSSPFFVEKRGISGRMPDDLVNNLEGFIRVNVPPLNHHASVGFYENRVTCCPNREAVSEFRNYLES